MRKSKILGWLAVIMASLISCFWAFWGSIENFHEGWHYATLQENLLVMVVQYLSFMIVSIILSVIAIFLPRIGAMLYLSLGAWFSYWILSTRQINIQVILSWLPLTLPLLLIAIFFWFGQWKNRKLALFLVAGIPLLICLTISVKMGIRVSRRNYDGNYEARVIQGNNNISLLWAPRGPGWPKESVSWEEANRRCAYLKEDGKELAETPQNIWRLPKIEEIVCSLTRNNQNCQGKWNSENQEASYQFPPDKESPLWDIYSPVIYWWTSEEQDKNSAYIVIYHGGVVAKLKKQQGSTGFRAVKKMK